MIFGNDHNTQCSYGKGIFSNQIPALMPHLNDGSPKYMVFPNSMLCDLVLSQEAI